MRICGQGFSRDLIGRIQEAIRCEPQISRRTLSRQICQWIEWRSDRGDWQEGVCRKALAELHRRELIELLPEPTAVAPRQDPNPVLEPVDLRMTLAELGPLDIVVIDDHRREEAKVWRALMERHHYLGDKPLCGAQLRYLVRSPTYGVVAALSFNSASWALQARDRYIWLERSRPLG